MSRVTATAEINTIAKAVQTAHSAYTLAVELNNRKTVNQSTQSNPYLKVQTRFFTAEQADMADHPKVKQYGQVRLIACAKGGDGEVDAATLLDFAYPYFEMQNLALLRLQVAEQGEGRDNKGWWEIDCIINFYYHRTT